MGNLRTMSVKREPHLPRKGPSRGDPVTQAQAEHRSSEGLRERKKRQTRQLISDTATEMFLREGYDAVRVIDVAAASGVAEKTVYNYFPTKESLIFDRFEDMEADIRRSVEPGAADTSLVEAIVEVLEAEVHSMFNGWSDYGSRPPDPKLIRRFAEMIQQTPALRAAQWEMMDKMGQVAAEGIARRAGISVDDPESQIAANAILGLWRIQFQSMVRNATNRRTAAQVRDAVVADVRRAAQLIDTGLRSFAGGQEDQSEASNRGHLVRRR